MDRQLSNFDIAICILVPLVVAALGFVAHQLEGHDERIIQLEKTQSAIEAHMGDQDQRLKEIQRDVREVLRRSLSRGGRDEGR